MAFFNPSENLYPAPVCGFGVAGGDGVSVRLHADKENAHNMNSNKVRLKVAMRRWNRSVECAMIVFLLFMQLPTRQCRGFGIDTVANRCRCGCEAR
jgi:hypothetical protein